MLALGQLNSPSGESIVPMASPPNRIHLSIDQRVFMGNGAWAVGDHQLFYGYIRRIVFLPLQR